MKLQGQLPDAALAELAADRLHGYDDCAVLALLHQALFVGERRGNEV